MKLIKLLLIGFLFVAYGCNDDIYNADPALENANLKNAEVEKTLPIIGNVYATIEERDEYNLGKSGKISGVFSHFGQLNEEKSTWQNGYHDLSNFPIIKFSNETTFCTANGDFINAQLEGFLDARDLKIYDATCEFTSGTGRFENVSGDMDIHGYAIMDEQGLIIGLELEGEGEISNVGRVRDRYRMN